MSARNRELLALVPASLLLTAGFAAIFIQESDVVSDVSLTYGALFLGLCFAGHLFLRVTLPHADPYMFPLVAVLACFGLVVIYRIDDELAREQAQWFVIGLGLFAATILLLRDLRVLERYRYTIALVGLVLLLMPRVPGLGQQVNGAYLGVGIGPISFQPAEFGKIAIIIFLAAYLRDTRQVLVQGSRRILGVTIPPLKHFGPLLVVWGAAMVMLVFIRDLGLVADVLRRLPGGALRGHEPALVRDDRVGAVRAWARGSWRRRSATCTRASRSGSTRSTRPTSIARSAAPTRSRSRCSRRPTAGCSAPVSARRCSNAPGGTSLIPAPHTDLIYAVIASELGLVGRVRPAARLHAVHRARIPDRDARHATRSRSCWRPG